MLSVLSLLRGGLQTLDITASERLGDGKRDKLLARQDLIGNTPAKLGVAEVQDRR